MSLTEKLLVLGLVAMLCALPWVIPWLEQCRQRRRQKRIFDERYATRERIEEIEGREGDARERERGKTKIGKPFWRMDDP